jgi:hypothetical protein
VHRCGTYNKREGRDLCVRVCWRAVSLKRMNNSHNSTTSLLIAHCPSLRAAPRHSENRRNYPISFG